MDKESLQQILSMCVYQYEQLIIENLRSLIERGLIVPDGHLEIAEKDGKYFIANCLKFKPSNYEYMKDLEATLEKTLLENEQLKKELAEAKKPFYKKLFK